MFFLSPLVWSAVPQPRCDFDKQSTTKLWRKFTTPLLCVCVSLNVATVPRPAGLTVKHFLSCYWCMADVFAIIKWLKSCCCCFVSVGQSNAEASVQPHSFILLCILSLLRNLSPTHTHTHNSFSWVAWRCFLFMCLNVTPSAVNSWVHWGCDWKLPGNSHFLWTPPHPPSLDTETQHTKLIT